jgi:HPr kinase/phosphorylase
MQTNAHNEHGVFLCIFDVGLLITGEAGIGKSTLALELIERGHSLVSDDVVTFEIQSDAETAAKPRLLGKSPYILKDLLAVRDLGVINIRQMFSPARCVSEYYLDLIIELISDETVIKTTLTGIQSKKTILNHTVPLQKIHAHPKRNLALIIETAVNNYILSSRNDDAALQLKKRQQQYMAKPL